jgi:hypothetical protein
MRTTAICPSHGAFKHSLCVPDLQPSAPCQPIPKLIVSHQHNPLPRKAPVSAPPVRRHSLQQPKLLMDNRALPADCQQDPNLVEHSSIDPKPCPPSSGRCMPNKEALPGMMTVSLTPRLHSNVLTSQCRLGGEGLDMETGTSRCSLLSRYSGSSAYVTIPQQHPLYSPLQQEPSSTPVRWLTSRSSSSSLNAPSPSPALSSLSSSDLVTPQLTTPEPDSSRACDEEELDHVVDSHVAPTAY